MIKPVIIQNHGEVKLHDYHCLERPVWELEHPDDLEEAIDAYIQMLAIEHHADRQIAEQLATIHRFNFNPIIPKS